MYANLHVNEQPIRVFFFLSARRTNSGEIFYYTANTATSRKWQGRIDQRDGHTCAPYIARAPGPWFFSERVDASSSATRPRVPFVGSLIAGQKWFLARGACRPVPFSTTRTMLSRRDLPRDPVPRSWDDLRRKICLRKGPPRSKFLNDLLNWI